MMESVQNGTVAALRYNGKTKSFKNMESVFYMHPGCFVSGSWIFDGGGMLRDRAAKLDVTRQISVILFQK